MDAGPYDNVEFPVRPATQTWPGTQTSSTKLYGYNISSRDRLTGTVTPTLAPVVESEGNDHNEDIVEGEEQRNLLENPLVIQTSVGHQMGLQEDREFHSSPVMFQSSPNRQADKTETVYNKDLVHANTTPNAVTHKFATMPNMTAQKATPMPSPSLSRAVVEQPRSIAKRFTEQDLNPRSQEVFNKTYAVERNKQLHKILLNDGNKMKENVWDVKGKPGEMMSYEQLLQGMLVEGEMLLLGGSWLQFANMDFLEADGKNEIRPSIGRGRLCLTNQRLLILSADIDHDASLFSKDQEYKLEISKCTTTYFKNIPLTGVLGVELSATVGNSQESRVTKRKPCCCCGLCSCLPVSCCRPSWKSDPTIYKSINERVIRIGVVMPPWQTQTLLVVHLHPDLSLAVGRDFVSLLHNHAPKIR